MYMSTIGASLCLRDVIGAFDKDRMSFCVTRYAYTRRVTHPWLSANSMNFISMYIYPSFRIRNMYTCQWTQFMILQEYVYSVTFTFECNIEHTSFYKLLLVDTGSFTHDKHALRCITLAYNAKKNRHRVRVCISNWHHYSDESHGCIFIHLHFIVYVFCMPFQYISSQGVVRQQYLSGQI